jgi:hypothetical protein
MSKGPLSLNQDDFDALLAHEDLQRRLVSFARAAVVRMRAEGFDASVHLRRGSVLFVHDAALREGLQLRLEVDSLGIEVSLRVPSSDASHRDWRNLCECARQAEASLQLTTLLEGLPEPFGMGPSGELTPVLPPVPPEALRAILRRCERASVPFWVGWRVSREVAAGYTGSLDEELEDALLALVPVARFVVWDETNDYLERKSRRSERDIADERDDLGEDGPRAKPRTEREAYEPEDEPGEPSANESLPLPSFHPPAPPAALRFLRRAALVTEVDPSIPVEKGTRVRVLVGPFVGKVGVVSDLDVRTGRARVLLGLLSTTCNVTDLIAARERDRKPLMSSHRRFK